MLGRPIRKWVWTGGTRDMDRSVGQRDDKERIEAEAAEWVIRLGGEPLSPEERQSFELWCAQSASHAKAFEFARHTWSDLAALRHAPGSLAADIASAGRSSRPSPSLPAVPVIARRRSGFWRYGVAAAICLIAAAGAGRFWYGNPATLLASDYHTNPGEQRSVDLPDGSVVELSTDSAIALHFDDRERRVTLIDGAAYFTVAPMGPTEKRPFVVEGANGTATALGTQFAVERLQDAVEVTVAEHDVRVTLADMQGGAKQVVLSPGQSVRYSPAAGLGKVSTRDVEQATAWRRGRLIFDQVPLAEVVAELNRYRRGRIVITGSTLANRRVSGVSVSTTSTTHSTRSPANSVCVRPPFRLW